MRLFKTRHPQQEGPMTTISEVRAEVQREVQQMLAIVEGDLPETATDAEHALWVAGLQLGAAMMRLFFASQAARWPSGRRYDVAGVPYHVEGAEVVEIGTKFGKVEVTQPVGRPVGKPRARRDLPMARAVALRRKVLDATINHFTKNRARMRYQYLRQHGLVISSGLIEGTVRHLVGMRLDGPGMRWGKGRAEAVLHLRCVVLNGLWTDFESYLARRASRRLAAQPARTVPHDAKSQLKRAA